jgi:hypothetical protein
LLGFSNVFAVEAKIEQNGSLLLSNKNWHFAIWRIPEVPELECRNTFVV